MSPLYDPSRFVDYYEVLGVPPTAANAQITQRYLFLRSQAEAREGLPPSGSGPDPAAAGDPSDRVWQAVSRFNAFTGRSRGGAAPQAPSMEELSTAYDVLSTDRAAYDSVRRKMLARAVSVVGGRASARVMA